MEKAECSSQRPSSSQNELRALCWRRPQHLSQRPSISLLSRDRAYAQRPSDPAQEVPSSAQRPSSGGQRPSDPAQEVPRGAILAQEVPRGAIRLRRYRGGRSGSETELLSEGGDAPLRRYRGGRSGSGGTEGGDVAQEVPRGGDVNQELSSGAVWLRT